MTARVVAAQVLAEVLTDHVHLDSALERHLPELDDRRDRALTRELCSGVLRQYPLLARIIREFLNKPLKPRDNDIHALLLCGIYQLRFLRVPDHAAISSAVETSRLLNKGWAAAMVNAVLRRYQRESATLATGWTDTEETRYLHPAWLIDKLKQQWPDHWQTILEANNIPPPLHLRVDPHRTSLETVLAEFSRCGIEAEPLPPPLHGVSISRAPDVREIPGFDAGWLSVQDASAQLAATFLDVHPGDQVLDACAAPGGKTGHLLERYPDMAGLVAVDMDRERITRLEQNLDRIGHRARIRQADLTTSDWWDGGQFDRILLDAPCSATGVIRRHPDIKYHRTPAQLSRITRTQDQILDALWPLLRPGGRLLYTTCSILTEETDDRMARFIAETGDAEIGEISSTWGSSSHYGRFLLPGYTPGDGFYYAILVKKLNHASN